MQLMTMNEIVEVSLAQGSVGKLPGEDASISTATRVLYPHGYDTVEGALACAVRTVRSYLSVRLGPSAVGPSW